MPSTRPSASPRARTPDSRPADHTPSNPPPTDPLFREFSQFYAQYRCQWSPVNPRRVYNFAFSFYDRFAGRLSPAEFLGVLYQALGFRSRLRSGLFAWYDPAKYPGSKPHEEHFLDVLKKRLLRDAGRAVRKLTDNNKPGDARKFTGRRGWREAATGRLEVASSRGTGRWEQLLLEVFLDRLEARLREVVRLRFWEGLTTRQAGDRLGTDHKAVVRTEGEAIRRLRGMFESEGILAN